MTIDYFRVKIQQIKLESDRVGLNKMAYQHYPDVFLRTHETLGAGKHRGGTPVDFDIEGSSKGIFALKKIVERFDPWIIIEGINRVDKTDFPTKLFKNVDDGGVGKYWTSVESRITGLDYIEKITEADYFRVNIQQFEEDSRDRLYLNEIRHDFADAFIEVYEKYGPENVETGTPKEFALANNSIGLYVIKKVVERYDPWIVVSTVQRYDRVNMPDELFKNVEEGGVGEYWSEKTADRIDSLDWP